MWTGHRLPAYRNRAEPTPSRRQAPIPLLGGYGGLRISLEGERPALGIASGQRADFKQLYVAFGNGTFSAGANRFAFCNILNAFIEDDSDKVVIR